jgi:uncharacterized protein (UPF0332 family)
MSIKEDYIVYRIQRAEESYNEAFLLADKKHWNTAANRLYYSCFYAVIALLLKNDINTNTHIGAINQFGLHFVKTEKIDGQFGRLYSKLFDYRQKGDYGDMFDFTEEIITPLMEKVPAFINEIKKHL